MKTLYESVISADTRRRLGESYTPDWRAEAIVDAAVPNPLEQRVLDPACGSGTFLFHAVRRYLTAARDGKAPAEHLLGAVAHVAKFEKGVLVERPEQAATTEVAARPITPPRPQLLTIPPSV